MPADQPDFSPLPPPLSPQWMEGLLSAADTEVTRRLGPWRPPDAQDLQKALPQYAVEGILGRGGMGVVYRGRHVALHRPVAIKVLAPGLDDGELRYAERFQQEARVMAKLNHPNIVTVHDAGETAEGLLYLVMELIQGEDAGCLLRREGKLDPRRAVEIMVAVCEGLAAAHRHGIVHRDIKPSNVIIDTDGRVKVADFGLAKQVSAGMADLTDVRVGMGTPGYAAPEMWSGRGIDQRVDIYGAGAMLYQMITGQRPHGVLDASWTRGLEQGRRMEAIISKAMRHDPAERYATAAEMRAELAILFTSEGSGKRAGGGVAAVALCALALWQAGQRGEDLVAEAPQTAALTKAQPASAADTSFLLTPPPPLDGPLFDPATPAVDADGWRSVLREKPEAVKWLGITYKGDGWYRMSPGFFEVAKGENAALRVRARHGGPGEAKIALLTKWGSVARDMPLYEHPGNRMAPYSEAAIVGGKLVQRPLFGYQVDFYHSSVGKALFEGWPCVVTSKGGRLEPQGFQPSGMTLVDTRGDEYEMEVRTQGQRVETWLNGKLVQTVKGITLPGEGFAVWSSKNGGDFKSLDWRPLKPEELAPPDTPEPNWGATIFREGRARPSATGLAEWRPLRLEELAAARKAGVRRTGDRYLIPKTFFQLMEQANVAVRLRCAPKKSVALVLGWTEKRDVEVRGFRAQLGMLSNTRAKVYTGWIIHVIDEPEPPQITGYRYSNPEGTVRVEYPSENVSQSDEEHDLELRKFSDRLLVLLDGQLIQEYNHVKWPGKGVALYSTGSMLLTKLEWQPLTAEGKPLP